MYNVEFPGLWDLNFTINRVAFSLFGLEIYWYALIISSGLLLSVLLGIRFCKNYGIEQETIMDAVLFAVPAAIIMARLYYVVFSWNDYKDNPSEIFNFRNGGMAIYGGIIGALLATAIYARVKKINILNIYDFSMPYIALAQAIGRWGNFINQEAYGYNTNMPWGMTSDKIRDELSILNIPGIDPYMPVHPTFLYESLWNLGVFLVLIWFMKKRKTNGEVFYLYMILYGIGRAVIEGLRTDSLMFGPLRISQVVSIVLVVLFGTIMFIQRKRMKINKEN